MLLRHVKALCVAVAVPKGIWHFKKKSNPGASDALASLGDAAIHTGAMKLHRTESALRLTAAKARV